MAQGTLRLEDVELEHDAGRLWLYVTRLNLLPLERIAKHSPDPLTRRVAWLLRFALGIVNEITDRDLLRRGHR